VNREAGAILVHAPTLFTHTVIASKKRKSQNCQSGHPFDPTAVSLLEPAWTLATNTQSLPFHPLVLQTATVLKPSKGPRLFIVRVPRLVAVKPLSPATLVPYGISSVPQTGSIQAMPFAIHPMTRPATAQVPTIIRNVHAPSPRQHHKVV
jgi:hypothetical protein